MNMAEATCYPLRLILIRPPEVLSAELSPGPVHQRMALVSIIQFTVPFMLWNQSYCHPSRNQFSPVQAVVLNNCRVVGKPTLLPRNDVYIVICFASCILRETELQPGLWWVFFLFSFFWGEMSTSPTSPLSLSHSSSLSPLTVRPLLLSNSKKA